MNKITEKFKEQLEILLSDKVDSGGLDFTLIYQSKKVTVCIDVRKEKNNICEKVKR